MLNVKSSISRKGSFHVRLGIKTYLTDPIPMIQEMLAGRNFTDIDVSAAVKIEGSKPRHEISNNLTF